MRLATIGIVAMERTLVTMAPTPKMMGRFSPDSVTGPTVTSSNSTAAACTPMVTAILRPKPSILIRKMMSSGLLVFSSVNMFLKLMLWGSLLMTSLVPLSMMPTNSTAPSAMMPAEIMYSFLVITADLVRMHTTGTTALQATRPTLLSILEMPAALLFSSEEGESTASMPWLGISAKLITMFQSTVVRVI